MSPLLVKAKHLQSCAGTPQTISPRLPCAPPLSLCLSGPRGSLCSQSTAHFWGLASPLTTVSCWSPPPCSTPFLWLLSTVLSCSPSFSCPWLSRSSLFDLEAAVLPIDLGTPLPFYLRTISRWPHPGPPQGLPNLNPPPPSSPQNPTLQLSHFHHKSPL